MQQLQYLNQGNVENLKNVRRELLDISGKKEGISERKVDEIKISSTIKNTRDLSKGNTDFKRDYQSRPNVKKDQNGDLVTDSCSILGRWRSPFSQLLNARVVNDVRQTEMHTAIPLVPDPSAFEIEMAIEKIKRQKSPGTNRIPAVLINLQAPCIVYIGQAYRYSPEYAFYIFSQQIYSIIFLDFLSPSSFILPQNVVYFLMLHLLVHKIFTFYINGALNCKCPAPGPKG